MVFVRLLQTRDVLVSRWHSAASLIIKQTLLFAKTFWHLINWKQHKDRFFFFIFYLIGFFVFCKFSLILNSTSATRFQIKLWQEQQKTVEVVERSKNTCLRNIWQVHRWTGNRQSQSFTSTDDLWMISFCFYVLSM